MNRILREQLAAHYEKLAEMERHWRDQDGKLYGCGPDLARKCEAIKVFADAHGYRLSPDEYGGFGVTLKFDTERANALGIPPAFWPEAAQEYTCEWRREPQDE